MRRIEYVPLDEIQPAARNPKRHSADLEAAVDRFGFADAVIQDGRTGRLVAGHGRWDDLRRRRDAGEDPPDGIEVRDGVWSVPVQVGWSSRSDQEADAFLVAHNRLTEAGGWDEADLAALLDDLGADELDGLGFDEAELAELADQLDAQDTEPSNDQEPEPAPVPDLPPTVTLLEGDVLEQLRAMDAESVQCVVTSPPYWGLRYYGVEGAGGLEETLEEHLDWIVAVFSEVRRVLRQDGVCWVNYGDAYASNSKGSGGATEVQATNAGSFFNAPSMASGLAAKQRLLLPARVALALQADGWWVRSEIVWAKGVSFCPTYAGSCMPSSVRDRPTDSHEMLYLLTKRARYFYDGDAVREAAANAGKVSSGNVKGDAMTNTGWASGGVIPSGRNLRTVWTIGTQAYSEAHFATFPEKLVEPCVLAGTSERGACSECGAPWRRVVELSGADTTAQARLDARPDHPHTSGSLMRPPPNVASRNTTGWEPTCDHADAPTRPCVVLDPFNGSGTTGVVSLRHGRAYVGIELNPEYLVLARKRIAEAAACG